MQDLEFNKRLKKNKGKIFLIPNLKCTYFCRETFKSFFLNRFDTGKWVVLTSYLTNDFKSISLRHMAPLFFSLIIILTILFGLFINKAFFSFFIFIVFSYSIILYLRCMILSKSFLGAFYRLIAYFTLHFSYGIGSLYGFLMILKYKGLK